MRKQLNGHLAGLVIGVLLIVTGLAFFVLLALVGKVEGWKGAERPLPILAIISFGALLMWVGSSFLAKGKSERLGGTLVAVRLEALLIRNCRFVKVLAVLGCIAMASKAMAFQMGVDWPNAKLVWLLTIGPLLVGLASLGILDSGSEPFSHPEFKAQPLVLRLIEKGIVRIAWIGYPAGYLSLSSVHNRIPVKWQQPVGAVTASLICFLYGSQFLSLHFGRAKQLPP